MRNCIRIQVPIPEILAVAQIYCVVFPFVEVIVSFFSPLTNSLVN
jgi:hypothetical protein